MQEDKAKPDSSAAIVPPSSLSIPPISEEERRLRLKIDLHTVPFVAILYALCTIDRVNIGAPLLLFNLRNCSICTSPAGSSLFANLRILTPPGNARLAGLERTLGLKGNQYNALLSIFYVSYILFSIPASYVIKALGPGWVLPGTTLVFGILTTAFAFVQTFQQAAAVRFLLGIFEAGLFGGCSYYLSRWYRRSELAFRLSLYIVMAPLSGAASGLLASGLLKLEHFGSTKGWQMIFAIEGVITIGLALVALVFMTDRPETVSYSYRTAECD